MSFTEGMHLYWKQISNDLLNEATGDEKINLNLHAEDSEFIRFNNCKVRQNSGIQQINLSLELQKSQKSSVHRFSLSGEHGADLAMVRTEITNMRKEIQFLPQDPFLLEIEKSSGESRTDHQGERVDHAVLAETLKEQQGKVDLAGFFCQGPVIKANANSLKQSHWFSTESFVFDYSLYDGPRAVKSNLSGSIWSHDRFSVQLQDAQNQLSLLQRPKRKVSASKIRTYFAPMAVAEIFEAISRTGLSEKSFRQGRNGFQKAGRREIELSPKFSLRENFYLGLSPRFNEYGEMAADELFFFKQGQFQQFLTSSKTAKEFEIPSHWAPMSEAPRNLELLPGELEEKNILKELGTGLYLSNLHYLSWSDRNSGRMTGMTRYACFWVENGEIVSPIEDLRFDDSVLHMFGKNLLDLTKNQEIMIDTISYLSRPVGGMKVPGMLVDAFQLK